MKTAFTTGITGQDGFYLTEFRGYEVHGIKRCVMSSDGSINSDLSKPDGTMHKLLGVSKLANIGWQSKIEPEDRIASTYSGFLNHKTQIRAEF